MPGLSLVVCLYGERDLLDRLLAQTVNVFDDLVVVHDGPEALANNKVEIIRNRPDKIAVEYAGLSTAAALATGYSTPAAPPQRSSIHELVTRYSGQFFEGPRCFQQEPHWPFAWSQAKHDWILRLDADELPSEELQKWLLDFRRQPEPSEEVSGYTCYWPIWNGEKYVTRHWPYGRNFFFHRRRVSFFGMVEQVPVADRHFEFLPVVLSHQPLRKSHGLRNILVRRQGARWREVIAQSLVGLPDDLPRWRWNHKPWPEFWERLRLTPLLSGFYFLLRNTLATLRDQWRKEGKILPLVAVATPLHHLLIALRLRQLRRKDF